MFTDNGDGTATIAGTPASGTAGSYPVTITAANGVVPDANQSFTLSVNQAPALTSAASHVVHDEHRRFVHSDLQCAPPTPR